jgi:hypothetical protein
MWAVLDHNNNATIVSDSERGAKRYATLRGYDRVCQVGVNSWICFNIKYKRGSRWINS